MAGLISAAPITVQSYDLLNGEASTYNYWDLDYSGAGNTSVSGAPLSGGSGDLTDGIISTKTGSKSIVFNFGSVYNFQSLTVHVDDSNAAGGVSPPSSIVAAVSGRIVTQLVSDSLSGAPLAVNIALPGGFTGSSLSLTLNDGIAQWIFVSEVTFDGQSAPIPEPGTWVLLSSLAALALVRARRQ